MPTFFYALASLANTYWWSVVIHSIAADQWSYASDPTSSFPSQSKSLNRTLSFTQQLFVVFHEVSPSLFVFQIQF